MATVRPRLRQAEADSTFPASWPPVFWLALRPMPANARNGIRRPIRWQGDPGSIHGVTTVHYALRQGGRSPCPARAREAGDIGWTSRHELDRARRAGPERPGSQRVLRARGAGSGDHFRRSEDRQFRPWRALHDRGFRLLRRRVRGRIAAAGRSARRLCVPVRARYCDRAAPDPPGARGPGRAAGRIRDHDHLRPRDPPAEPHAEPVRTMDASAARAVPRRGRDRRADRQRGSAGGGGARPGADRFRHLPAALDLGGQSDPGRQPGPRDGGSRGRGRPPRRHARVWPWQRPRGRGGGADGAGIPRAPDHGRDPGDQGLRRCRHRRHGLGAGRHRGGAPAGAGREPGDGAHPRHDARGRLQGCLRPCASRPGAPAAAAGAVRRADAPTVRASPAVVAGALLLLALLILPPLGLDEYWIYILTIGFYYAILAASWSLLVGYVGRISFAQAAFAGLGAYTSALATTALGWPILVTVPLGVLVAALIGLVIGRLCLELHGAYLGLTTIAFAEILRIAITAEYEFTRGSLGLSTPGLFATTDRLPYYYTLLAVLLGSLGVMWLVLRSRIGLFFKAVPEDEEAAATLGVRVGRWKIVAFTLSSAFAGLAGGLYAHVVQLVSPT